MVEDKAEGVIVGDSTSCWGLKRIVISVLVLFFLPWLAFLVNIPDDGDDARIVFFLLLLVSIVLLIICALCCAPMRVRNMSDWTPVMKASTLLVFALATIFSICVSIVSWVMISQGLPFFFFVILAYGSAAMFFAFQFCSVIKLQPKKRGL